MHLGQSSFGITMDRYGHLYCDSGDPFAGSLRKVAATERRMHVRPILRPCHRAAPHTLACISLPTAYLTSFKNAAGILQGIQSAQAPTRFTQKFLEGIGFPSTNDRTMINVLKALGFLDDSGVPTRRYHEYLDQTQSALVLAQGIRDAYEDLFHVNKNAHQMNANEVKNKMKTLSEGSFTDRVLTQMAGTFTTLVKGADFSAGAARPKRDDTPPGRSTTPAVEHTPDPAEAHPAVQTQQRTSAATFGGLVYNINIHLPESRDQAVYDALFKALREHLT